MRTFYDELNAYYKQKGKTEDLYIVGEVLSGASEVAPYYQGLPALFEFDFWYRLEWAINNSTGCYFVKDIMSYQQLYAANRTDYIEATKLRTMMKIVLLPNWVNPLIRRNWRQLSY